MVSKIHASTNAILISGAPGTGKTTLAMKIALHFGGQATWLPCTSAASLGMRIRPNTKVITVEVSKLEELAKFADYMGDHAIRITRRRGIEIVLECPPFFIFQSQLLKQLPEELKWNEHLAHFHLSSFYSGVLNAPKKGTLPPEILKIIYDEMERRQTSKKQLPD